MVERGRLKGQDAIGVRVGKVVNKYKVAKHFTLDIGERHFAYTVDENQVAAEAALDGLYVIRTSVAEHRLSSEEAVRSYKRLSDVERAFRSLKTVDLQVRPIYHRLESRVRAHIFLCMLAYYVLWHMREAWRPLLFCDEDQQAKATRDPVAPAERSASANHKAATHRLHDGTQVHSFTTLLKHLSTIVRNTCRIPGNGSSTSSTSSQHPMPPNKRLSICCSQSPCRQTPNFLIRLSSYCTTARRYSLAQAPQHHRAQHLSHSRQRLHWTRLRRRHNTRCHPTKGSRSVAVNHPVGRHPTS